mgnify:CR=1 FL=1
MGEHSLTPIYIFLSGPIYILALYESTLSKCRSIEVKDAVLELIDIQRRECMRYSEDVMRLCGNVEIGKI